MKQQQVIASALALALGSAVPLAQAQQGLPDIAAADTVDASFEPIVVTGSNRADSSLGLDATAPVHVITAAQIEETGAATLNEVLSRLDPSFNFPQGQNAVKGQGVRSVSLRGVAPAYTLILVNGKRRNASAELAGTDPWPAATVVDLNTIPISAVERIDVLKDGAAAQYGSDAIAGVVNIILKDRARGGEVNLRGGGYTDGGGATEELTAWKGLAIGDRGSATLSIDLLNSGQVDRTAPDWRQIFVSGDPRNGTVHPDANWIWGDGSRKYGTALANADYAISTDLQAYGWLNYSHKSSNNYVNPERLVKTNNNPSPATLASAGPTTPNLLNQYDDPWGFPNGYQPNMTYIATDLAEVVGAKIGNVDAGKWDIALSEGSNSTGRYAYNTYNPSWGPASPTSGYLGSWISNTTSLTADYLKTQAVSWLEQPLLINAGLLARHENWAVGDVGAAWTYTPGALASTYKTVGNLYKSNPGLLPSGLSAAQIATIEADKSLLPTVSDLAGIQPVDVKSAGRDVKGLYLGTEADLTSKLQAGITGRYERYSDFGNTLNGKLTGRYDWTPQVAVRSTLSTGFHAPSLAELAYQATGITGTLVNGGGSSAQVPGYTRQFAPNDPAAAAFGAKALEPEKSTTLSLGSILKPTANSSLTADAYYLKIRDAIQVSGSLSGNGIGAAPASGTVIGNLFAAEGLTGFTTASYYLNAWDQATRGVDLVGKDRLDQIWGGTLDLTAQLSLIDTTVNPNSVRSTASVGGNVFSVIAPAQVRDVEYGTPRNKLLLNGHYVQSRWILDATFTRFGQYRYDANGTNGIADQVFHPETYVDLGIAYQATDRVRLELGAQNLLNRYPDPYNVGNRQSGVNKYSFIAPNGSAGRFVYVGVNYSLN